MSPHYQQHQLVFQQILENTGAVQLTAVKSIEKLEQRKQCKQHGRHLLCCGIQKVERILAQEHDRHIGTCKTNTQKQRFLLLLSE